MEVKHEILRILDEVLGLNGKAARFSMDTPLLGSLPELDSMAVVALLTAIEDRFGVTVQDDEVDGATFESVGALVGFVELKLAV